jgi:hypothetical protein
MQKTVDDYIDLIQHKWPDIPRQELKEIVEAGFHRMHDIIVCGGRVIIKPGWYSAIFSGCKKKGVPNHMVFGARKQRYLYNYAPPEFDGYYYFGVDKATYDRINKSISKNKKPVLRNILLHKIKDETYLFSKFQYFFKTPYPVDIGFVAKKLIFRPRKLELIAYRDERKHIIELNGK